MEVRSNRKPHLIATSYTVAYPPNIRALSNCRVSGITGSVGSCMNSSAMTRQSDRAYCMSLSSNAPAICPCNICRCLPRAGCVCIIMQYELTLGLFVIFHLFACKHHNAMQMGFLGLRSWPIINRNIQDGCKPCLNVVA